MSKDTSDIEREFEEEMRKKKLPEERQLPEETEFEREYAEEMEGEELPEEIELDPFAEKLYELSGRTFKTETELDKEVNGILNEIERDYFFKDLLKKTKKSGKLLLKKGLKTFKGISAFQAAKEITQLARGNLKGTLDTLAKAALKVRVGAAVLPVLGTLGFKPGEQNREAWQNFAKVCEEAFDYLARNLNENADEPIEASKLASEAFGAASKKVKSELKSAAARRLRRVAEKMGKKKIVDKWAVIALGIACIVLAAGLVAAFVVYPPMTSNLESQIAEKDRTISSLNSTVLALQNSLNQSNYAIKAREDQITALNNQIATLFNYLYLNVSSILVLNQPINQAAGANITIWNDMVQFAGYITVAVQSSSNTTYVEAIYSSYGVNYDNIVTVGTSGTAAFPILPALIEIRVGNTEAVNSVTATVTATYYY